MTNAEKAKLLRSAASALEHGRYSTARKKIEQATKQQRTNWSDAPYVLITIIGGVADTAVNEGNVSVDLLDYDNLKDTAAGDVSLSDREWKFLEQNDKELFDYFSPSYALRGR